MATRVFITGISGYIGGQLATDLSRTHPELYLVGLVRNNEQFHKVKARLPEVEVVLGDLSSFEILLEEAKKADVVIQAADCDNIPALETLIKGLSQGGKSGSYIHLSGAASTAEAPNGYGAVSSRIYDDIRDIVEITTFDSSHIHSDSDQAVIREGNAWCVKIALLLPTVVYGEGEGPIKTTSMTFPWLEQAIVKRGKGFTVGGGKNSWGGVHVKDVSAAFIKVVEDALRPDGRKMTWGPEAIYYVVADNYIFAEVVPKLVEVLKKKGLVQSNEIEQLSVEESTKIHPHGAFVWGSNSRCQASRLQEFGWRPTAPTFWENLSSRLGKCDI